MTTLGELYSSYDTLKKLGLDTTELEEKINDEEERVLHDDIKTAIKDIADMLFRNFRRDVNINLEYKAGEPVEISIISQTKPDALQQIKAESHKKTIDRFEESDAKHPAVEIKQDKFHSVEDNQSSDTKVSHMLIVSSQKGAYGMGIYNKENNTFKLLTGSIISPITSKTFCKNGTYEDVINNYCHFTEGKYKLIKEYIFNSPSTASSVVLGRSSNGWVDWKDRYGRSLNNLYPRSK